MLQVNEPSLDGRASVDESPSAAGAAFDGGTEMLRRLVAEWRAARVKLGLATSATFTDVARKLDVDRGTAQRLNRVSRLAEVGAADLGHFPGVRAWNRVLAGVERVLGAEHPNYQTLSLACDHYAAWLGGSRSAAVRRFASAAPVPNGSPSHPTPTAEAAGPAAGRESARARWVDAAAEVVGYGVDVRLDLVMVRETAGDGRRDVDLSTVNVLKGCRGGPAAMPLAFTRVGYTVDHQVIQGNGGRTRGRSTSSAA